MAATVVDIATLRRFMDGLMDRADEDTVGVIVIALALLGGIVWQGDPGSFRLQERDGEGPVDILWASFGARMMTFSYNHQIAAIEMREGTVDGPVVCGFTTRTLERDIEGFFGPMRHRSVSAP